jgi:hypothetical protein
MTDEQWKDQYQAPEGQTWVCGACGKHNHNRVDVGDESCFLNAVLCYDRQPWEAVKDDKEQRESAGVVRLYR